MERLVSKLPLTEAFQVPYLEQWGILPLEIVEERLRVATAGDPPSEVLEDLEMSFGVPLELVPVSPDELADAIRRTFAASESVVELVRDLGAAVGPSIETNDERLADARGLANQPP